MPLPLLRQALAAWPQPNFVQVYGLTELAGVISTLSPEAHRDAAREDRLGSAGTLLPGAQVRVVDLAAGQDAAVGLPGEFWFRSAQQMMGYLNKPDDTARAITEDGWLRSGDIGHVDDGGFLFLSDRVKDMIITGGENVYSSTRCRVLPAERYLSTSCATRTGKDATARSDRGGLSPGPGMLGRWRLAAARTGAFSSLRTSTTWRPAAPGRRPS
jgi:acyl-CoA synthetase (AMP-forming)/AMP-acid ligase II